MKRTLLALVLLTCACGDPKKNDDTATDTATGAEETTDDSPSTATDSATSEAQPFTFANTKEQSWEGTGDDVVKGIALNAGAVVFHITHTGDDTFSANLLDAGGDHVSSLIFSMDDSDIKVFASIEKTGTYVLEMKSSGKWTASIVSPKVLDAVPDKLSGDDHDVSPIFPLKAGVLKTMRGKHPGEGLFSVILRNASSGAWVDLMANEIDGYDGESALAVDEDGYYLFEIKARGTWSMTIK